MNLLEPFKNYLFSQNDKPTKVTVKNYLSDINRFIYWYEATFTKSFTPKDVAKETIEQYKQDSLLDASALSPRSLERHLSSLRKFFTFLKYEGLIVRSPFEQSLIGNQKSKIDPWRIKDFKDYLYIYNASRLTIKNYLIDLKQFIAWAQEVTTSNEAGQVFTNVIAGVNTNLVEEYKQRLLDQDNFSSTTINRKLSSLPLRRYIFLSPRKAWIPNTKYQIPDTQDFPLSG
jgi:site-specific recombinase XerD